MENSQHIKYAIQYLDNGGTLEKFPRKHKELRKVIEIESKRRFIIYIVSAMEKSSKFSLHIQKEIKSTSNIIEDRNELFTKLNGLSYKKLENLKKKSLQHSK